MITSRDYFLVLRDTPTHKQGTILPKVIVMGKMFYGTDKRNRFFTKEFLLGHPEAFEYAGKTNS